MRNFSVIAQYLVGWYWSVFRALGRTKSIRDNIAIIMRRGLGSVVWLVAVVLVLGVIIGTAEARSHKKASSKGARFDYYLLALSFAPDFCDQPQGDKDPRECGAGNHVGYVVHGLWPQGENTRGPQNCSGAGTLSPDTVQAALKYMPTESLIQHEWVTHGSCSGLKAPDYFATVAKARDSVKIPDDLNQPSREIQLSPMQIESKMASANPTFPREAFRVSCYPDKELQELRICFNKDLSPRGCTSSAGACASSSVTILPVR